MKKNALLGTLSAYFTEYLPVMKGLSNNTIRSYKHSFQLLFTFLKEMQDILPEIATFNTLEKETIEQFLSWLEKNRSCSISTRNQRLSGLSSFARYAVRKEPVEAARFYNAISVIPKKKCVESYPIYFTREETSIMLNMPVGDGKIASRDRVLLSVLYASGARAQELCDIKVRDIRFGEKTSIKLMGKGNRARTITIPDNCTALLKRYLDRENKTATSGNHLFSSQMHEHMTISCVEEIVKKYISKAITEYPKLFKEKKYTPHSFRHSIAVHMLETGIPLPVIKNFLGHVSLEATLIYATVSDELKNKYLKENSIVSAMGLSKDIAPQRYENMGLDFLNRI